MKVILLREVKGIGRANEVIETKDGHALNFLIPKKLAIPATPTAIKEAELRHKQEEDQAKIRLAILTQNISSLAEARIVIKMKANEKGHLYDAVDESDIIKAAKNMARIDLPKGIIKLEKPIKNIGTYDIPISSGESFGRFSIIIEAE